MKKIIALVILLIIIAIFVRFFIYFIGGNLKKNRTSTKTIPNVVVDTVKSTTIVKSFDVPGRVVSKYQVNVVARISGYLMRTYFKEGEYVKAEDTLFLIEPMEYQNASNSARANYENIKSQLDYAEKQLKRAEELLKNDYIAKSRYDEILANKNSLQAQLNAAKTTYMDTKRTLNYTQVKAPVNGRIGFIDVSVGNYVSASTGPLTTINSTDPIYVTFPLSSANYSQISLIDKGFNNKRKVEIYFQDGTKYDHLGVQDFYDNEVDKTTGSVTLRATVPNPQNRLLHGEFVNVKLYSNNKITVPIVPVIAVQENQEGKYVYTVDDNGLPRLTYIKVFDQFDDNWLVSDGINIGDEVIVDGVLNVIPGNPINIISRSDVNVRKKK